jgi:hypothetical protein
VKERRGARTGTVSGLALLAGGTALAAVTEGAHSPFVAVLLGLLTLGLAHSLIVEIRRQARRGSAAGWARHDTINAVLLGVWAEIAVLVTLVGARTASVRAVGVTLAVGYAGACGYFVTERRRAVARTRPDPAPDPDPPESAEADHVAPAAIPTTREPAKHR